MTDPEPEPTPDPPPNATSDPAATAAADDELLAKLADDFSTRLRRGERPTVQEYTAAHPELGERLDSTRQPGLRRRIPSRREKLRHRVRPLVGRCVATSSRTTRPPSPQTSSRGCWPTPIAKPGNRSLVIDFVAEYMTWFIAHEFAHLVGVHHTAFTFENPFNEPVTLMDKDIRMPMGPDLVFGTPDDVNMQFGVDAYDPHERCQGVHNTLNTFAFALSTGKGVATGPATFFVTRANDSAILIGRAFAESRSALRLLKSDENALTADKRELSSDKLLQPGGGNIGHRLQEENPSPPPRKGK